MLVVKGVGKSTHAQLRNHVPPTFVGLILMKLTDDQSALKGAENHDLLSHPDHQYVTICNLQT